MSSFEGEEAQTKYQFRGKFGAAPTGPLKVEEATHEEIDRFVKDILGLDKEKDK